MIRGRGWLRQCGPRPDGRTALLTSESLYVVSRAPLHRPCGAFVPRRHGARATDASHEIPTIPPVVIQRVAPDLGRLMTGDDGVRCGPVRPMVRVAQHSRGRSDVAVTAYVSRGRGIVPDRLFVHLPRHRVAGHDRQRRRELSETAHELISIGTVCVCITFLPGSQPQLAQSVYPSNTPCRTGRSVA